MDPDTRGRILEHWGGDQERLGRILERLGRILGRILGKKHKSRDKKASIIEH